MASLNDFLSLREYKLASCRTRFVFVTLNNSNKTCEESNTSQPKSVVDDPFQSLKVELEGNICEILKFQTALFVAVQSAECIPAQSRNFEFYFLEKTHKSAMIQSIVECTYEVIPGLSLLRDSIPKPLEMEAVESIHHHINLTETSKGHTHASVDLENVACLEKFVAKLTSFRPDVGQVDRVSVHCFDTSILAARTDPWTEFFGTEGYYSLAFMTLGSPLCVHGQQHSLAHSGDTKSTYIALERRMFAIRTGNALSEWKFQAHSMLENTFLESEREDKLAVLVLFEQKERIHDSLEENLSEPTSMPTDLEREHVHDVYDNIADHFSHTRHHPWPVVREFVEGLPLGSLVADIGCGNGKYMGLNKDIAMLGSDRSIPLLDCCVQRSFEVFGSDALKVPLQSNRFDVAISIALLHHLSTVEHRLQVLRELSRIVKINGEILLVAWAFQQDERSKRKFKEQDSLVEWKLQNKYESEDVSKPQHISKNEENKWTVYQRYCHLYLQEELELLIHQTPGIELKQTVYSRSNWCMFIQRTYF